MCVSADVHCALDSKGLGFFSPLSVNVTAKNTSAWEVSATSCQAGSSLWFSIISGHKFIRTVCFGGEFFLLCLIKQSVLGCKKESVVLHCQQQWRYFFTSEKYTVSKVYSSQLTQGLTRSWGWFTGGQRGDHRERHLVTLG